MTSEQHANSPASRPNRGFGGRVVVVGSANWDTLVHIASLPMPGETVMATTRLERPGGKGANQAVAATRAGARTYFVGLVGDDPNGAASRAALLSDGVNVDALADCPGHPTGTATILVSASGENQVVVVPGANAQLDGKHVHKSLSDLRLDKRDVCILGFETNDEAVMAATEVASAAGATIVVNPTPVRPIPDRLLSAAPIVVVNAQESIMLTDQRSPRRAARIIEASTGAPCVVTLGKEGAVACCNGKTIRVPARPLGQVEDTTGAGDTVVGFLSAGIAARLPITTATNRAVAAGTMSVTRHGARDGIPTSAMVDAWEEGLAGVDQHNAG